MTLDEQFEAYMDPPEPDEEEVHDPMSITLADFHQTLDDHDIEAFDPHEDDAFMFDILAPERAEEESQKMNLGESHVLTVQERLKLGRRMRFMSHRMQILRKMKQSRMAPLPRLLYRARKAALMTLRRKVAGEMGQSYGTLSPSQKVTVDNMVAHRYGNSLNGIVSRAAQRILPAVRKKETKRLRSFLDKPSKGTLGEQSNHSVFDPRGTIPDDKSEDSPSKKIRGTYNNREFDPVNNPDYDGSEYIVKPDTKDEVVPVDRSQLWPVGRTRRLMKIMNAIHEARKSGSDPSLEGDTGRSSVIDQLRRASKNRGEDTEIVFDDQTRKKISDNGARKSLDAYSRMLQTIKDAGDRQRAALAFGASAKSHENFLKGQLPPKPSGGKAMRYRPMREGFVDLPGVSPGSFINTGVFYPNAINPPADVGPLGAPFTSPLQVDMAQQINQNDSPTRREIGTPSLVRQYANMTPGQNGNAPYSFATFSQSLPGVGTDSLDDRDCGKSFRQYQMIRDALYGNRSPIAEKRELENGKKVPNMNEALNKPTRASDGKSKFKVEVMGPNGNPVTVRFGDPNMKIKRYDPGRRASFRARHNCDDPGPKWKARYWSCRQWRAGSKVEA